MRGGDETFEQRVRLVWLAQKFRVELARDVERMIFEFDDLNEFAVRRRAAENEAGFFKFFAVIIVELVTVTVAFVDDERTIKLSCD